MKGHCCCGNRAARRRCKGHRSKTGSRPQDGWFCADCGTKKAPDA